MTLFYWVVPGTEMGLIRSIALHIVETFPAVLSSPTSGPGETWIH